ncbi:MAG: ATP-binding protein [Gemmatimonadales bacterium]
MRVLRTRFFWKLFASYAALVLLAVITLAVVVDRHVSGNAVAETERSLAVQAVLLGRLAEPALRSEAEPDLAAAVRQLRARIPTRLTVMREDGTVIADSDEDPAVMDNHGTRPEVSLARTTGSGTATRFSRTVAANMKYFALAVRDGEEILGYVRTAVPLTLVEERLAELRRAVVLVAVSAATLALAIGLFLARRVTVPLLSLRAAADSLAAGDYLQTVIQPSSDEIGDLAGSFNRMAAELERRMKTITEDRAKLLTILTGMVEGVVAVDQDEHVVHLNQAAARMFGVSPAESIGKAVWEVTRVRKVSEAIDDALRDAREVAGELSVAVEGRDRILDLHGAPRRRGGRARGGAVVVLHDVTELRKLETVRRDFVANVSHELKTPITAIRGLVETIVDDEEMPEATRADFLKKIRNQSLRLSLLVTDLLTLARLEAAEGLAVSEHLDLRDPVRTSVAGYRGAAADRGVRLESDLPSDPIQVVGDAEGLELVANNLIDNALKYTPEGGSVRVLVRPDGDHAELAVEDTGVGIAPEHQDRIFERFYRVDKARSRELGGTGLGLSIVKHVCRAHGGTVTVESSLGGGATFRARIPLA